MKSHDPGKVAEYLQWVEWSYDEQVAQLCRERLSKFEAFGSDFDPARFAWECYCDRYADQFEEVDRMQDIPFQSDLLLDVKGSHPDEIS